MTLESLHTARSTVGESSRNNGCLVSAELSITVQSMDFPSCTRNLPPEVREERYLATMCEFYNCVINNYDSLWDRLQHHLVDKYCCLTVEPCLRGALVLRMSYASAKLVRLQVDAARGHLQMALQSLLVTDELMQALDVIGLRLTVDVRVT